MIDEQLLISHVSRVYQYLDVSLMRDVLQDDGFHGEDVGKLHLRDVERTHDVGPP